MKLNRIEDRDVQTFVHQPVAAADAPQRCGAQHVGRTLPGVLNDAIARADVVECEVAEWMDDLVAESGWDRERAAIDRGARSGSRERARMANTAADAGE